MVKIYDENVDREYLHAQGVDLIELLPWQFALEHPDLVGRFIWYPTTGALIYEGIRAVARVGTYLSSEEVWKKMREQIYNEDI